MQYILYAFGAWVSYIVYRRLDNKVRYNNVEQNQRFERGLEKTTNNVIATQTEPTSFFGPDFTAYFQPNPITRPGDSLNKKELVEATDSYSILPALNANGYNKY